MKGLFYLLPLCFILFVACTNHEETVVQKAVKRSIPASQADLGENAPKSMKELSPVEASTDVERVDLKTSWEVSGSQKAVFFSHKVHAEKYTKGNCDTCHSTPQGGDKIGEKLKGGIKGSGAGNTAHAFCWNCHNAQPKTAKTPGKTCTKCHNGK